MIINKKLYNYIVKFSNDKESKYLKNIRKKSYNNIKKNSMSDFLQGRLLSIISRIKNPKYILEIGTFLGYSTLCLCEGLRKKGKLISIEKNKKIFNYANININNTKYKKKIKILLGNALNILPKIKKKFDIIFIDADKKNYINYLNLIKNKIKKKGIILVDNVLWKGLVIKKKKDKFTKIIYKFNKKLKKNNYNNIIIPIRDGINLIVN
ncbi:MAG: class I SAM-dependent methyltransferase [Candidatus Shikimatogenerans bostrichidophilus]|nr:MAG: class I SAM-dependent methyltransferase [Candidatus Shikimatogenerans bostrichidophilus]